jgi:hypothetical protein
MTTVEEDRRQVGLHQREHEAAERAHRREHDADQRAIDLAVEGIDRRLNELNQLRKEVTTDRSLLVNRETYDADQVALKAEVRGKNDTTLARIEALEKIINRAEGSLNTWRAIAAFLGLGGVTAVIWAILQSGRPVP